MSTIPTYAPWLTAAFVVVILLWLAWRRPNKRHLVWRLLASAVAGVSLVLLIFPPATQQPISPTTAVLLTEGYSTDSLDALVQKLKAEPQLYSYRASSADDVVVLSSLQSLRQQQPSLQKLHLFGYGLEEADLEILNGIDVIPHLTAAPAGVQAINWPHRIRLGEAAEVTGRFASENKEASKLYLYAAGRIQDSVEVKADSTFNFTLRYTPKKEGRFTYSILRRVNEQLDTIGQVPVQVAPVQKLGVLLVASSPNFEYKFLKNHLAELQHKVALRTSVSKNITQSEWLNMPKVDLDRITPRLLQNFDAVITEPVALQEMSDAERAVLQRAVTEDGLGILTIATTPANNRSTAFFTGFQTKRLTREDTRNTRLSWPGSTAAATAAPYALINTTTVNNLIEEQGAGLLAGAKKAGWGKVAMSFLPQTFPWQLEGKNEVYASYWSSLLSGIAKEQLLEKFWSIKQPQVPQPQKPLVLSFTDYTSGATLKVPDAEVIRLADSAKVDLPLAQNVHQPEQYSGTFWPHTSGWHLVKASDAAPHYFYVHPPFSWPHADIRTKQQATQEYVARKATTASEDSVAFKKEPLPLIWFFVLFVLSSGFLWLEEKI